MRGSYKDSPLYIHNPNLPMAGEGPASLQEPPPFITSPPLGAFLAVNDLPPTSPRKIAHSAFLAVLPKQAWKKHASARKWGQYRGLGSRCSLFANAHVPANAGMMFNGCAVVFGGGTGEVK